jgi:hypothetical protein
MCIYNYSFGYIHARPVSPALCRRICLILSLDTRTIVRLTATKFEPFCVFGVGFRFCYVSNIHIIVILYDFYLLPAYFCYIIVNVRNFERQI